MNEVYIEEMEEMDAERENYKKTMTPFWAEQGSLYQRMRESLGMTAKELGRRIGVSGDTIRRFERGKPISRALFLRKALEMFFQLQLAHVETKRKEEIKDWYIIRLGCYSCPVAALDELGEEMQEVEEVSGQKSPWVSAVCDLMRGKIESLYMPFAELEDICGRFIDMLEAR